MMDAAASSIDPARDRAAGVVRLPNPMRAMVWLTIFVPGHLFGWWVERGYAGAVLFVAVMVLMTKGSEWETRKPSRQASVILFLVQFLYVTSYIYSVAFNGIQTGSRDLFEVIRYLIVWGFVVYVIRHFDAKVRSSLEAAMTAALYYSLFVLATFKYRIPLLTSFFRGWLYAETKTTAGDFGGQMRLAAPFENPNYLGFASVMTMCYLLFFSKARLRTLHIAAALLVVFFCGSRTAWAGTGLLVAAALATYCYQSLVKLNIKYAVQLSLVFLVLMISGPWMLQRVMASNRVIRVVKAMEKGGIQEEANAAHRLTKAREALVYIRQSPVFGWGPSKYVTMTYTDNQYLLWLLRNGALGAGLIVLGFAVAGVRLVLAARGNLMHAVGAASFVCTLAVMLLAGQFLDNFRLLFLAVFFAAAIRETSR